MCNLYRMSKSAAEVAGLFNVNSASAGANTPELHYPGHPGLVVADGKLRPMHWGFPLTLKGKHGQPLKPKPVNNARTDKLSGPFWRSSFENRRCLIPVSAYAEAEGPKGAKTRTWFHLPDADLFACAGIWRASVEWGDSYSMIITDANEQATPTHDRMPVIVTQQDWPAYLSGSPREAFTLCRPWPGEMVIERTDQPWVAK
ncbi:MAG: SOS response-associated peptidase family protein [Caenibius sp.]